MKTRLMPADSAGIRLAAEILSSGGLVVFPTETVYGLGARALDEAAVRGIFKAKGRPPDNPLIVHIEKKEHADAVCFVDARSKALMDAFWPGPMTLVMKKRACVPDAVTPGLCTVGVRMPRSEAALALIRACGFAVAAPSANRSGRPSPTCALDALDEMDGRVPLILDGGACAVGLESTVVDMTRETPVVLRPGGVTPAQIEGVLGQRVSLHESVLEPLENQEQAASPGMKYAHYAPEGEVWIIRGSSEAAARVICARYDAYEAQGSCAGILCAPHNESLYGGRRVVRCGAEDTLEAFAASFFTQLRALERAGARLILCEAVPFDGIGVAIMNRMLRAAAFRLVDADDEIL